MRKPRVIVIHNVLMCFWSFFNSDNQTSCLTFQIPEYKSYKAGNEDYNDLYWRRTEYIEGEDGELSWFNAGVRVGVGLGLGICLGVGIGVGLLIRTYQTTSRTFRRRLLQLLPDDHCFLFSNQNAKNLAHNAYDRQSYLVKIFSHLLAVARIFLFGFATHFLSQLVFFSGCLIEQVLLELIFGNVKKGKSVHIVLADRFC